jgi:hypothetical protein
MILLANIQIIYAMLKFSTNAITKELKYNKIQIIKIKSLPYLHNILKQSFKPKQTLFHSHMPFPKNLSQVIHFYKSNYVNLIETNLKNLQNFLLIVYLIETN